MTSAHMIFIHDSPDIKEEPKTWQTGKIPPKSYDGSQNSCDKSFKAILPRGLLQPLPMGGRRCVGCHGCHGEPGGSSSPGWVNTGPGIKDWCDTLTCRQGAGFSLWGEEFDWQIGWRGREMWMCVWTVGGLCECVWGLIRVRGCSRRRKYSKRENIDLWDNASSS